LIILLLYLIQLKVVFSLQRWPKFLTSQFKPTLLGFSTISKLTCFSAGMTLIGECMYIIYRCVIDEYVSYLLCLVWTKSYEIPFCLRCFPQNSRFLPKNRLAGMNVPPGDTSELTQFLGSAMNHLATMNYRYAVRRCSTRFLWCCDAEVIAISGIGWCILCLILLMQIE